METAMLCVQKLGQQKFFGFGSYLCPCIFRSDFVVVTINKTPSTAMLNFSCTSFSQLLIEDLFRIVHLSAIALFSWKAADIQKDS
jgi:hypothetical protein